MLTVLVRYEAGPGSQDLLRTELEGLLEPAAELPGCLGFELYVDPNRPDRMMVVEEWSSLAGWLAHRSRSDRRIEGLLAGPATVQCLGTT